MIQPPFLRASRLPRAALFVPLFALLGACSSSPTDVTPKPQEDAGTDSPDAATSPEFQSVLAFLGDQMKANDIAGASIAVVQSGKLTFSGGLGVKKEPDSDTVNATTLFTVASLSKMVLAATAMTLVEDGKLDPSRPVTDYVPLKLEAPFDASTITIHDLLTHTSGLPDLDVDTTSCPAVAGEAAKWFAANDAEPLWAPPGAVWDYCNRGYSVMGWVIEAIMGTPYWDLATSRILGPAGMTTATFDPAQALATGPAFGHVIDPVTGQTTYNPPAAVDCAVVRGPSGVMASAVDYAHFAEMLLASGGSTLKPSSVATMETRFANTDELPSAREHYGYGLFIDDDYKGLTVLRHNGSVGFGYKTSIWLVPAKGFAVIVFYNATGSEPDVVSDFALSTFLGLTSVPDPDYLTSPSTWGPYVGTYVDPYNLGTVDVTLTGTSLLLSSTGFGVSDVALVQEAGDMFQAKIGSDDVNLVFYPGPKGPAAWVVTREGVAARQ
jgi:CubicO group peptidase (beta-lactamase class C family)